MGSGGVSGMDGWMGGGRWGCTRSRRWTVARVYERARTHTHAHERGTNGGGSREERKWGKMGGGGGGKKWKTSRLVARRGLASEDLQRKTVKVEVHLRSGSLTSDSDQKNAVIPFFKSMQNGCRINNGINLHTRWKTS